MDEITKALHASRQLIEQNLVDTFEKGKAVPVGTIKKRPNGNFIKTTDGWKYHSKAGTRGSGSGSDSTGGHEDVKPYSKKLTSNRQSYDWGDVVTVKDGTSWTAVLHPDNIQAVERLKDGQSTIFRDEQNLSWKVTKIPNRDYYNIEGLHNNSQHKGNFVLKQGMKHNKPLRMSGEPTKQEPTLIQVLNDPKGKRQIEYIEEYIGDLRDQPGRKEHMEGLRDKVDELKHKFNYTYDIKEQEANYKKATSKPDKHIGDMNKDEKLAAAKKLGIKDADKLSPARLNRQLIGASIDKHVANFRAKK
jgi:hypothetical protein